MTQWEYKVAEVGETKGLLFQSKELKAEQFNELGREGWELVTAISVGGGAAGFGTKKTDRVFLIFKRECK